MDLDLRLFCQVDPSFVEVKCFTEVNNLGISEVTSSTIHSTKTFQ